MTWLTWRQTRVQAFVALTAMVAVASVAALTHPHLVRLSTGDVPIFDLISATDRRVYYTGVIILAITPAIVGAFLGAPLVARELESGTHRLVWNQSVTRQRWLAFRFGAVIAVTGVVVGLLSLSITWWSSLLDGAQSSDVGSLPGRMTPVVFSMRGLVPIGYAMFAVSLGLFAGVLVRRTVPAMAITVVGVVVVQIAMPLVVRPHLAPPVTKIVTFTLDHLDYIRDLPGGAPPEISLNSGEPGAWNLSHRTIDRAGLAATLPAWFVDCLPKPGSSPPKVTQGGSGDPISTCFPRLNDAGYTQEIIYHPVSQFWPIQWAETGILLLVAILLAGFSFWRVRQEG